MRTSRPLPALAALCALLAGCASAPPARDDGARGRIVRSAERLIGTPYRLGGANRQALDCSGLVQLSYLEAGLRVPRTTEAQFRQGRRVDQVLPGDLLFFQTEPGRVSHVGVYAGQGQMIHASSGAGEVRKVPLDQPYWQNRLVGGTTYLACGVQC